LRWIASKKNKWGNTMRSGKIIGRFPDFDREFFRILDALHITVRDEEYIAFLNRDQVAKDIVDVASLLLDAGILTRSHFDKILAHQEIQKFKNLFHYLKNIHSLTENNFNLIINCNDYYKGQSICSLIDIKNKNQTIITDDIFESILTNRNMQLIVHRLNNHSKNPPMLKIICTLLTENLLTESVLTQLKVHANPAEFAKDLKTAKFIAETYRHDKIKSGFFSYSSKASTNIVSSLLHFSTTGNYSFFQKTTAEKPGKRLQTILNQGDNASIFTRMTGSK